MKKTLILLSVIATVACTPKPNLNPEPFVGIWIESTPNFIQGFKLNANGTAQSMGTATLQYSAWQLTADSTMILSGKSIGNGQTIDFTDTLKIISITPELMVLGKSDNYKLQYNRMDNMFKMADSLRIDTTLGALVERQFKGLLPAASGTGIEYTLTIDNQEFSGDGVYQLDLNYLKADNGKDQLFTQKGKMYTLRGDATNINATVYQFIPFTGKDTVNMLYVSKDTVQLLNNQFEVPQSDLNYYLTLDKQCTLYMGK